MSAAVTIILGDALEVLPTLPVQDAIVTSLPELAGMGMTVDEYRKWFAEAIALCVDRVRPDGVAIFYQTDRRMGGEWLSKPAMIMPVAGRMLWHKIVLRRFVGGVDLHRPGYTHMMAFSRKARPGFPTADVIPRGRMLWRDGMGLDAAEFAAAFAARCGEGAAFCDPFCGHGSALSAAVTAGFGVVTGIDIDAGCCAAARSHLGLGDDDHGLAAGDY